MHRQRQLLRSVPSLLDGQRHGVRPLLEVPVGTAAAEQTLHGQSGRHCCQYWGRGHARFTAHRQRERQQGSKERSG